MKNRGYVTVTPVLMIPDVCGEGEGGPAPRLRAKSPSVENSLKARFPAASRPRSGVGWKQCWAVFIMLDYLQQVEANTQVVFLFLVLSILRSYHTTLLLHQSDLCW